MGYVASTGKKALEYTEVLIRFLMLYITFVLPHLFEPIYYVNLGFPGGSSGKESACNAGDTGETSLTPGVGRFPLEEVMATHSSILAWRIWWTEEPGRLQSIGPLEVSVDAKAKEI